MLQIMMEQKKPERNDITLSGEKLRKYFPRSYSPQRIEETIFKLLDVWMHKSIRTSLSFFGLLAFPPRRGARNSFPRLLDSTEGR